MLMSLLIGGTPNRDFEVNMTDNTLEMQALMSTRKKNNLLTRKYRPT